MGRRALVLAALALGVLAPAAQAASPTTPHPAASAPEKALEAAIRLADQDSGFFEYVTRASWHGKPADKGYSKLVTKALVAAIGAEEKRLVKANCGGKYIEGDLCGHGSAPLTCSQDSLDGSHYLYRTLKSEPTVALLAYRWPSGNTDIATYRMVLAGGRWMVDGVDCRGAVKYHMP